MWVRRRGGTYAAPLAERVEHRRRAGLLREALDRVGHALELCGRVVRGVGGVGAGIRTADHTLADHAIVWDCVRRAGQSGSAWVRGRAYRRSCRT